MTKSVLSKSSLTIKEKPKSDTKKYTCGCGKKYTSYPAYSTHRKSKHNNVDVEGSIIPRCENPKRGRPSYEYVKKNEGRIEQLKNYYQGLTVIQLGLLKLNQRLQSKIISQSHQSNHYNLPEKLKKSSSQQNEQTKCQNLIIDIQKLNQQINSSTQNDRRSLLLTRVFVLFIELMTTHMNREPACALIEFVTEFAIYVGSTQDQSSLQSDDFDKDLLDVSMFNNYFSRQQNKEQINRISSMYNLQPQFFVIVSVILSHWMYKVGFCQKVIKLRSPENSNQLRSSSE